jgi:hypothetical protein
LHPLWGIFPWHTHHIQTVAPGIWTRSPHILGAGLMLKSRFDSPFIPHKMVWKIGFFIEIFEVDV